MDWRDAKKIALHWRYNANSNIVTCELCPNYCKLKENQTGICGVRKRINNSLYTLSYGFCISPAAEVIETEAVFHFQTGARILSMGNIGCNLKCSFCQNWETSQIECLDDNQVFYMSPEDTIKLALANNIEYISWTYNDPVVWQEYVIETSQLAKKHGIITIYKSAFYINSEPIKELIECIDIFSISLKSMDENIYKRVMKGSLKAVLNGIIQIYKSKKHLEISQLVVTRLNDNLEKAAETARWIIDNLDKSVPLHYVSYHPAFKYHEERSSYKLIETMCQNAKKIGIQHCYAGNVIGEAFCNTYCSFCRSLLIERTGLSINQVGIDENNNCMSCGNKTPLKKATSIINDNHFDSEFNTANSIIHYWENHNSLHLVLMKDYRGAINIMIERFPSRKIEYLKPRDGLCRLLVSRNCMNEDMIKISVDTDIPVILMPLLDRAHFPTVK